MRNEIVTFLKQKNAGFGIDELGDPDWLTNLAFPTDFTSHMNKLNLQLQGKGKFINQMYDHITVFRKRAASLGNSTNQFQLCSFSQFLPL